MLFQIFKITARFFNPIEGLIPDSCLTIKIYFQTYLVGLP
jgi:hypothetical protein